ncbi:MAG: FAD-binding oxidoreductase [Ignavibacteriales bacterium]|nr:FAD-binding oxidoreductase [Ignavibacteriales bacterium]
MKVTGWGNYPVVEATVHTPSTIDDVKKIISSTDELIARGLGRSYGDSSLNHTILSTLRLNHILAFDEQTGTLTCEAGVSLAEILDAFVPRGWFLPVTPGTKYVTVGGAVASDIHGKNHHVSGSFSNHVHSFKMLLGDGTIVVCSRTENVDLFWATCGGMGLTGVILEATFSLIKIETAYIRQRVIKARNIDEALDYFEENQHWTYSVAWIDCLAKGDSLGRSALILGEHATKDEVGYKYRDPLKIDRPFSASVPFFFPDFVLNTYTIQVFNMVRYASYFSRDSFVEYEPFFYPLDMILDWNKIYGKRGFTQYQFVIPKKSSAEGLKTILKRISESGEGSFLAVLKLFGKQEGILSFPQEGYTLALDFPLTQKSMNLFTELDEIITHFGGRLYLTKDVRMKKEIFEKGYENLPRFMEIKRRHDPQKKFLSLQSRRIGIV